MGTAENSSDSRLPIATGALVIVLLCAFWLSNRMVGDVRADFDARLAEAAEYLMEYPYLDVHPRLEAFAGADEIDHRRRAFWIARERRGAPAISNALRSRHQQVLDEKVERAFATLDGLPERVWGLNPNRPSASSFFTHAFIHS